MSKPKAKRYSVRMAGIGGQGVVTASHVLSNGVIIDKGESTMVPFFGSEKRMAPVESYVRIAEDAIYEIGEIIYPNVIVIFHTQVITHGKSYTMPFYTGLKPNGVVIINSETELPLNPDEERELREMNATIFHVPASRLAVDIGGTDLATNMGMVGAIAGILGMPNPDAIGQSIKERFIGKGIVTSGGTAALDSVIERKFAKKAELVQKNMDVAKAAREYAIERGWDKWAEDTNTESEQTVGVGAN
ncbi:MAG: 2-oxoacid:acceptor oxidoreductase family protein [Nitrospiria bacterium]